LAKEEDVGDQGIWCNCLEIVGNYRFIDVNRWNG
jgi:hypothetical protein